MKRLLTLSFQYYYLLLVYNIAFSIAIALLFMFQAHTLNFTFVLTSKLLGFCGAVFLFGYSSGKSYFYFRNAGVTIPRLIINAFIIDVMIFSILATLSVFVSKL